MNEHSNKKPRVLKGVIVSTKMEKTAVVVVTRLKKHPTYKKYYKVSKKFKAHHEGGHSVGDTVMIEETRPLSKDKRWKIL